MFVHKWLLCSFLLVFTPVAIAMDLRGVWVLDSGEYVNGEGELVSYESLGLNALKIISDSHFSFTSMKGDAFWASGSGTYEVKDGKYAERLIFNSFGESPGTVFEFESRIDDDLWYNARWEGGNRVEYEVWRRVE